MASSMYNLVFSGRTAQDLHKNPETRFEVRDQGLILTSPTGSRAIIPTRQPPAPGSKVEAAKPLDLDELVGATLVEGPQDGGGAVNASVNTAQMSKGHEDSTVKIHLIVENKESPSLTALGDREGFGVTFANLSDVPINLVVSDGADRTIVKSPVAPPLTGKTLDDLSGLEAVLRDASAVVIVSPSDSLLVAALMAYSNGALRVAQPTGAMDLASTMLMLQVINDLVVGYDDLVKLATQSGCHLDEPRTEDSPQAVEIATRALQFLRDRHLAGSKSAVVTLGRHGCVVGDWESDRYEHIGLDLFEQVATRSGAGDTFLGAWALYRALGHGPVEAAVRATRRVVEWHGLNRHQYQIRVNPG
jgi:sugar/nucleoside kinase (ribokinase family)